MKVGFPLLAFSVLLSAGAFGQSSANPVLSGYVTRTASNSDFDVDGIRILCDQHTQTGFERDGAVFSGPGCPREPLHLGDQVEIFGSKKRVGIAADQITVKAVQHPSEIIGSAIIDAIPAAAHKSGSLLVRADGYPILLTLKTEIDFAPPLKSISDITTNVWIQYRGSQRSDGVVVAESAGLRPNIISPGESNLLHKTDYDPGQITKKQSPLTRAVTGVNPKKVPPFSNPAMQARVSAVGEKLIPAYQRNLPDSDLTKIIFRFQLVDEERWHDALTMPSGVILVPRQVVERMQNDSQLAAVLADNIACALERQTYRAGPETKGIKAGEIAADAGGVFVPGLSLAAAPLGLEATVLMRRERDQSGRVALGLMHDAGYDIHQAPLAWWLLASGKPKPIRDIPLPERAISQYKMLGTTWETAVPANTSDGH